MIKQTLKVTNKFCGIVWYKEENFIPNTAAYKVVKANKI